jgi:aminoglycoside phosphotransferase (APT) family kinase protein
MTDEATAAEPLVDVGRFSEWAHERLPGDGPIEVDRLREGHSNLTFVVRRHGFEWIMRRPPRGPLLPTAHDVLREYRVLDLLQRSGATVRIPRVVAACEDSDVIGVPFYLMEKVSGTVIRDRLPDWLDDDVRDLGRRRALAFDLVDALAELHSADPAPFVEAGIGRASGYLERQIRRWRGQREGIQAAAAERGTAARDLPDYDAVRDWLEANLPLETAAPTVVHGDYKLDNVLSLPGHRESGTPPQVNAILDWEMATVGDPLADLGYLLALWMRPGDASLGEFEQGGLTRTPGFAERDELVARYEARTGRPAGDIGFYEVLALWKLAVLMEGNVRRAREGTTDDAYLAAFGDGVVLLAEQAAERAARVAA